MQEGALIVNGQLTAGKLMVTGSKMKGSTLKTTLAIGPAVSRLAPSAAYLNCRNIEVEVISGKR